MTFTSAHSFEMVIIFDKRKQEMDKESTILEDK